MKQEVSKLESTIDKMKLHKVAAAKKLKLEAEKHKKWQ